jgi:zinc protease
MFASYTWFESYLERIAAVTPQDVQRVAQTYLLPQQRVLGIYQPAQNQGEPHE